MALGDFDRLALFLEKVEFQALSSETLSDQEMVDVAQSIWDAAINSGDVIPGGVTFPTTTMGGNVAIDWDADQLGFVLSMGTVYVRDDDLTDSYAPASFDASVDHPLQFHDDEFAVYDGGTYDNEIILLDIVA